MKKVLISSVLASAVLASSAFAGLNVSVNLNGVTNGPASGPVAPVSQSITVTGMLQGANSQSITLPFAFNQGQTFAFGDQASKSGTVQKINWNIVTPNKSVSNASFSGVLSYEFDSKGVLEGAQLQNFGGTIGTVICKQGVSAAGITINADINEFSYNFSKVSCTYN